MRPVIDNEFSQHHRLGEQLKAYWATLRGDRPMPLESDVRIEDLKPIWSHCFLVSLRDTGFGYDYFGTDLVQAYGDDITGKEITERLLFPHPQSLLATFASVAQTMKPQTDQSEFVNMRGMTIKYRSCVVPLAAENAGPVRFLLGGMNWKAY